MTCSPARYRGLGRHPHQGCRAWVARPRAGRPGPGWAAETTGEPGGGGGRDGDSLSQETVGPEATQSRASARDPQGQTGPERWAVGRAGWCPPGQGAEAVSPGDGPTCLLHSGSSAPPGHLWGHLRCLLRAAQTVEACAHLTWAPGHRRPQKPRAGGESAMPPGCGLTSVCPEPFPVCPAWAWRGHPRTEPWRRCPN